MAMASWRTVIAAIIATLGLLLALTAGAADLQPGREFRQINPPLVADRERIEVTEFFWYGCPHCFDFEPLLAAWGRRQPIDVSVRRVPAVFPRNKWASGARVYFTLEAMGLLDSLHTAFFNAVHVEHLRFEDEKQIFAWVAGKGVDAAKFAATWTSFGVQTRVRQAHELTMAAGLNGVPAVIVDGRFQVINPASYSELTARIDGLIERVRAERARK